MIKANELRIGNYVHPCSDYKIVLPITSIYARVFTIGFNEASLALDSRSYAEQECYQYRYSRIEPIPLTEEWLLNFSFESFGDWFIIKRFPVSLNVSIKHDKTTFGHNEEYDIENIKYVHQLQNLYYTLTGEELKYSVPA